MTGEEKRAAAEARAKAMAEARVAAKAPEIPPIPKAKHEEILRVTFEMVGPHAQYEIGRIEVKNDGTSENPFLGNYQMRWSKDPPDGWRPSVQGFDCGLANGKLLLEVLKLEETREIIRL